MIYACNLHPILKNKLGSILKQERKIKNIADLLSLSPSISGMEMVVLQPKDLKGLNAKSFLDKIKDKNDEIQVLYFYENDKDYLRDYAEHMQEIKVSKLNPEIIVEEINKAMEGKEILKTETQIISSDLEKGEGLKEESSIEKKYKFPFLSKKQKLSKDNTSESSTVDVGSKEVVTETPTVKVEDIELNIEDKVPDILSEPIIEGSKEEDLSKYESIESRLKNVKSIIDLNDTFKSIDQDIIIKNIIKENSNYFSAVNTMEFLDIQIRNIYYDKTRSNQERLAEIQDIIRKRSALKDVNNNMLADKVISIIELTTTTCSNIIAEKLADIQEGLDKIVSPMTVLADNDTLNKMIQKRLDYYQELQTTINQLENLYSLIDTVARDTVKKFEEDVPTSDTYINSFLEPVTNLYRPLNTEKLIQQISESILKNQMKFEVVEVKIKQLINILFRICSLDTDIIKNQENTINLLKANRVEDIIIPTTIVKAFTRIVAGGEDSGKTATAIILAGISSRVKDTLVIDFSSNSKLSDYGIVATDLMEYLSDRKSSSLTFLTSDVVTIDDFLGIIESLKELTAMYGSIFFIFDDKKEELLKEASKECMSVTIVSNCSDRSQNSAKNIYSNIDKTNTAVKVALIDPPIDSINLASQIADLLTTKLITLPHSNTIRGCAIKKMKPYENTDICLIYKEAFK